MSMYSQAIRSWGQRLHDRLDRVLYGLATYAMPVLIILFSLVALSAWEPAYPEAKARPLLLQVIADEKATLVPAQALEKLQDQNGVTHLDTQLAEHPFWLLLSTHNADNGGRAVVEFTSRHGSEVQCWDANSLKELGRANREHGEGQVAPVKAGFALTLDGANGERTILCKTRFVGPARIAVQQVTEEQLLDSTSKFHRESGLLDGGLIILALFVLITALINRQSAYVLFAAWLLLNLRMGAISAGWDTQWLGQQLPEEWLTRSRQVTTAAYYFLTATLFASLFKDELPKVGYAILLRLSLWSCLPLLVLSVTLPYQSYLPVLWVMSAYSVAALVFLLIRILVITHSAVAMWYIASIGVTLFASLYEVIAAALSIKGMIGSVNSVTAALASGLMASLAIAAQMRQEHRARLAAQDQLQQTYDAIPIGMFTLDLQGRFTSINPALRKMLGPRAFKSLHNTWQQYFGVDIWHKLLDLVKYNPDGEIEIRSQMDITGTDVPRRYMVKAALSGDKIEGSMQDVTEKSLATEELNFLADNDSLTKVLNRRGIEKVFDVLVEQVDESHPMALAYLDLDRFKLINDLYGHNVGDEVLRQVCQRVSLLLSGHMRLGRVGGDEFVILMPETRMPLATVICHGIVNGINEKPFRVGEKAFHVRGSIGLIEVSRGAQMKEALSTSDRACREAKQGQHRGLVVFERNSPAFQEHQAELHLIGEISSSETIKGLFLEMQPIMSLTRPHDALNFEVLLRMRDASGQLVPVSRVISAAEQSGRMSKIDHWVLSTTLAWLDKHRAKLQHTQFVCINLSGASLNDEEFMQEVFDILRRNSHVSSFLSIEITESVALHDLKNTRRFINRVRSYGARVALDDFGAGYTSFSYLKELPADLLKIDGGFVINMNQHPANVSIVEAIVNLARNLGMKTIAEWAEDTATVQALADIGVDYVQGFAVAHPMDPEKLLEVTSAAGFIKDAELLQFVDTINRQNNPLAQLDLLQDGDKPYPPKIH